MLYPGVWKEGSGLCLPLTISHGLHSTLFSGQPSFSQPQGKKKKKQAMGLIDRSVSLGAAQSPGLGPLQAGIGRPGSRSPRGSQSPGAVSAFHLLTPCELKDPQIAGCHFPILCLFLDPLPLGSLQAAVQNCQELSRLVPVSESLELWHVFLVFHFPPSPLFCSFLLPLSLISSTSFCPSPLKFRTLQWPR